MALEYVQKEAQFMDRIKFSMWGQGKGRGLKLGLSFQV